MIRVLVFPSCNEPGLEVVHALLKSNKLAVYGGSSGAAEYDPSAALLKHHLRCPYLGTAGFATEFRRQLSEHRIDLVFPTVDSLVAEFSTWSVPGTGFITPNPETARLFLSKSRTYDRLAKVVAVPEVYPGPAVPFPAYAKPDVGSGGKGHVLVTGEADLAQARSRNLLITEYLPGDEFTVDCLNDLSGRLLFANVRLRGQIGRGIALGTKGVLQTAIADSVRKIAETVSIEGPWFAQFKLDAAGHPKLLEVNPRVAGSMTLTRLMGVNIPLASVFLFRGYPLEIPEPVGGVVLNRCLRNLSVVNDFRWVIWDLDDTLIRKDHKPDPDLMACLFDFQNRGIRQALVTKNLAARALLAKHQIPNFFADICATDDKLEGLRQLLDRHRIAPAGCIVVNDSFTEKLALQQAYPELRIVTPDAVDLMGREKLA